MHIVILVTVDVWRWYAYSKTATPKCSCTWAKVKKFNIFNVNHDHEVVTTRNFIDLLTRENDSYSILIIHHSSSSGGLNRVSA